MLPKMLPNKAACSDLRESAEGLISGFWYSVQTATVKAIVTIPPRRLKLGGTWNCPALSKKVTIA